MILKDHAVAINNGAVNSTEEDVVEAYQFVNDNGYTDELNPKQLLRLRELVESQLIATPRLFVTIP